MFVEFFPLKNVVFFIRDHSSFSILKVQELQHIGQSDTRLVVTSYISLVSFSNFHSILRNKSLEILSDRRPLITRPIESWNGSRRAKRSNDTIHRWQSAIVFARWRTEGSLDRSWIRESALFGRTVAHSWLGKNHISQETRCTAGTMEFPALFFRVDATNVSNKFCLARVSSARCSTRPIQHREQQKVIIRRK